MNQSAKGKTRPVDIIVPVYNGYEDLLLCVESLKRHTDLLVHRVVVIDDKSPDERILPYLTRLSKDRGFVVLFNDRNQGFSANVNKGLSYSDRDTILLNSDTIVTEGWVDKLQRCSMRSERIATVTPLSNAATLASVPEFLKDNRIPDGFSVDEYAELIEKTSLRRYPRITVAVGFCMYVRQKAYEAAGAFDEAAFGRGYGEENDFCCRLSMLGYTHVLCDDTFIYHRGTASFDTEEKEKLARDHDRILRSRYPSLMEENDIYCRENPDQEIRDNLKLYTRLANGKKNLLYFLHLDFQGIAKNHIGGTQLHVRDLTEGARKDFNVFVAARDGDCLRLTIYPFGEDEKISLKFRIGEKELFPVFYDEKMADILRAVLTVFDIDLVHVHHTEGLTLDIFRLCKDLRIPVLCTLHDYYYACPTVKLVDLEGRFCPPDGHFAPADDKYCRKCLHHTCGYGHVSVIAHWREENLRALSCCQSLIFPSESAKEVMLSAFPELASKAMVIPHGSGEAGRKDPALKAGYDSASHMPHGDNAGDMEAEKTASMKSSLDQMPGQDGGFSYVTGWAYIEGEDAASFEACVQVKDRKGQTFCLPVKKMARPDVADFAADGRYLHSGFHAVFDLPAMAYGKYRLRIVLKKDGRAYTDGRIYSGSYQGIPADESKTGDFFRRKEKKLHVAFLGGVTRAKGSKVLSEIIHSGNRNFEFFVFGQVGDPQVLKERCPENVHFSGVYEQEDLGRLLASCRIDVACILPIWGETFCYTVSEAWQSGVPVIGTDIGAVGERIRKTKAGWLLPPSAGKDQVLALLDSIRQDPKKLEAARRRVRELSLKSVSWMNAEYRALYGGILKTAGAVPCGKIRHRNSHPEDLEEIFQALALADPSVRGHGGAAERNRLFEENSMLRSSIDMMKNTTSYRFARRLAEASIPGKEVLKKALRQARGQKNA